MRTETISARKNAQGAWRAGQLMSATGLPLPPSCLSPDLGRLLCKSSHLSKPSSDLSLLL